jgi:hypothetical protein
MTEGSIYNVVLAGRFVLEVNGRGSIRAIRATQRASRLVLLGSTLSLSPGDSHKFGFEINHIAGNV